MIPFRTNRYANGDRLEIAGCPVRLRVDGRARRVSLRLDQARREVVVTAPSARKLSDAIAFARERAGWMNEVLAELPVEPDEYAVAVVTGVGQQVEAIDERLRRYAKNWDLERMPALDRAILRMATFELSDRPDVPRNVVLNEAVELAKTFSTEESGRFVNGMLSALADELRPTDG